jgi:hypothetical protein
MSQQQVIFVLGGGSGTSALTRLLSLTGCALPPAILGADSFNPRGYWEPIEALKLNDEFLFRHGSTFFDASLRLQEENVVPAEAEAEFLDKIEAFLGKCSGTAALVIKEPRITPLFRWWKEAARRAGLSVTVVNAVRHPGEVADALGSVLKASPELSNAIWLKYNLLAERLSRELPRVFVEYSHLLDDWRAQVTRISRVLSVGLDVSSPEADGFITRDLYRRRHSGPVHEVFGERWLARAYAQFSSAAEDKPIDLAELDALYHSYRTCERAFRVASADSRSKYNPGKLRAVNDNLPQWTAGREY